jgi:hypothetical protein
VARTIILRAITQLRRACACGDAAAALEVLVDVVPEYEASDVARKVARLASLRVKSPGSHESVRMPVLRTEVFGRTA